MRRFDASALFVALDRQRIARAQSWSDVARETGVSVATIRRTEQGGRMEVDGMLALVGWLGVPVETFVRDSKSLQHDIEHVDSTADRTTSHRTLARKNIP